MQVFSLDWDKQYLEDDVTLRGAGGYDANDIQLLDPLPPGAPLWSDLPALPAPSVDGPQPVPPEAEGDAPGSFGEPESHPALCLCSCSSCQWLEILLWDSYHLLSKLTILPTVVVCVLPCTYLS